MRETTDEHLGIFMLMEVFPLFSDVFFWENPGLTSGNITKRSSHSEAWIPPARCPLWRRDEPFVRSSRLQEFNIAMAAMAAMV